MSVDKVRLESALVAAWKDLVSIVEAVPEAEMEVPGVVEEWSVTDLLGHITFWAEKGAGDLDLLAQGRADDIETPGGQEGVDAWNKRESEARKGTNLAEVREAWLKSFDTALEALRRVPAEALETEVDGWAQWKRFAGDTHIHYREHAEHIMAWQRALETTEA